MNPLSLKIYSGSPVHESLEKAYLEVRGKEGRLYDDHSLKALPEVESNSLHYKEWLMRKDTLHRIEHYLQTKGGTPRILDLGCGNGWMTAALARKGYITCGVDINLEELKQAARVFDHSNLEFVYGDIFTDLPVGRFDIILVSAAFQYFKNPDTLLSRLKDYLNPKGEILIADTFLYNDKEVQLAHERTQAYFKKVGTEKMTSYYHHHSKSFLSNYDYEYLYQPTKSRLPSFSKKVKSPFPLVLIKRLWSDSSTVTKAASNYSENLDLEQQIMDKLLYFDLFKFPLSLLDLKLLLNTSYTENAVELALNNLREQHLCYSHGAYYSLQAEPKEWIEKRIKEEQIAARFVKKLPFYIRLIGRFPFVRGIAISGSLSKGVIHEEGDADYFIITQENRLWITRTFLVFFKKLFLLNSKKYFCVNYFVGENHLKIPDKNEFTATEIAFLIPVYNHKLIDRFKAENMWHAAYYPRLAPKFPLEDQQRKSWLKQIAEFLLDNSFGDDLDDFFLHITLKRWRQKFVQFDRQKFDLTLRSHKNVSKHHPQDYQSQVLKELEERKQNVRKMLRNPIEQ